VGGTKLAGSGKHEWIKAAVEWDGDVTPITNRTCQFDHDEKQ